MRDFNPTRSAWIPTATVPISYTARPISTYGIRVDSDGGVERPFADALISTHGIRVDPDKMA